MESYWVKWHSWRWCRHPSGQMPQVIATTSWSTTPRDALPWLWKSSTSTSRNRSLRGSSTLMSPEGTGWAEPCRNLSLHIWGFCRHDFTDESLFGTDGTCMGYCGGGVGEVWGNGFSFHLFGQFCWNHWMPNYHGISQVAFINKNEGKYSHSICPVQSTILNSFELLWLSPYYTDEANETQTLAEAHVPKPWFELWQSNIRIQIHKHHFSSSVYIQKGFFCVT